MDKANRTLYQARNKRVDDAIRMRVPDRVPIEIAFGYFPAKYTGLTCQSAYYDYDAWLGACLRVLEDFPVDVGGVQAFFPGKVLELLDPRTMRWPGHGTSECHSHQAVEGEHMKPDEYNAFFADRSDFMFRLYLPRISGTLAPFSSLPPLSSLGYSYQGALGLADMLSKPDVAAAIRTLQKANRELQKWLPRMAKFAQAIRDLGYPPLASSFALAPFDAISDHLRGMSGTMVDMYRQPDHLLEACDVILKQTVSRLPPPQPDKANRVAIPLHRGSEGFMSIKQFEKFYWPTLKALVWAIAEKGLTPCFMTEGDYTSRLEYLLELPKAKVFAHFDTTDIFRAKEVLRGHMCIVGNVPCSLLQTGTPEEVRAHCKKLIDVVGKDGGYIMSTRSPVDDVKPENLKALVEFTTEYGVYK